MQFLTVAVRRSGAASASLYPRNAGSASVKPAVRANRSRKREGGRRFDRP